MAGFRKFVRWAVLALGVAGMVACGHRRPPQALPTSLPSRSSFPSAAMTPTTNLPRSEGRVKPEFVPSAIAFFDDFRGIAVGAMEDRTCLRRPGGCKGAIATTSTAGRSWQVQRRSGIQPTGITVAPGTEVAWTSVGRRLARSEDGGRTWHFQRSRALMPSFATPELGLAVPRVRQVGDAPQLLRTTRGGKGWQAIASPCPSFDFGQSVSFPSPSSAWALCFGEPGAGSEEKAVFRTSDAGSSWTLVSTAMPGSMPSSLRKTGHGLSTYGYADGVTFLPDGRGWLTTSGFRGVFQTSLDGGSGWRTNHLGKPEVDAVSSVSFIDAEDGWALRTWGERRVQLLESHDGGTHWTFVHGWKPGRLQLEGTAIPSSRWINP